MIDPSHLPSAELSDVVLAGIVEDLRVATGASRTTIRGPLAGIGGSTALLAESCAPGVLSMTAGPAAAIVEADTYVYLRRELDVLVQPDCSVGPRPPETLTSFFGVRAQLLGPLVDERMVIGTVSVHQQGSTREWSPEDVAVLRTAVAHVMAHWRGGHGLTVR